MDPERTNRDAVARGDRALSSRQLEFLALGGAVGGGLFLASGQGVHAAGPSLILAYLLAGAVVYVIARCLGEMALASPQRGTFVTYMRRYLGDEVAYVAGWAYWCTVVLVGMAELTGVGLLTHSLVPAVPQWLSALSVIIVLFAINRLDVRAFGEVEFWMSLLKVAAVLSFIALGVLVLATPHASLTGASLSNLWRQGGVFPNGVAGFLRALPIALFGFGGIELIGLAAAETRDPVSALPRAINNLVLRILIFYVGTMIVAMSVVSWNVIGAQESPFVVVLHHLHVPAVETMLYLVVTSAIISSCNSVIFGAGRVLASLAVEGCAPSTFGKLDERGVPRKALAASTAAISTAVILNYLIPARIFGLLLSSVAVVVATDWTLFIIAHLKFRRRRGRQTQRGFRVPLPPWCNWAALTFLGVVLAALALDPSSRTQAGCGLTFFATLGAVAGLRRWRKRRRAGGTISA